MSNASIAFRFFKQSSGSMLKAKRQAAGQSEEERAAVAKMSVDALKQVERGKGSIQAITRLAWSFGYRPALISKDL